MKIFWLLSACSQQKHSSISRNTLEVVYWTAAAAGPSALCYPAKGCLVPNCMWRSKDNHMTLQSDSTSLIRNTCLPRFSSSFLTGAFLDPRLHKADHDSTTPRAGERWPSSFSRLENALVTLPCFFKEEKTLFTVEMKTISRQDESTFKALRGRDVQHRRRH